jgi:tocopherol O-methyltransferase
MILPADQASTAAVARHYDELDPFYRELWGEHLHHGYWATGRESAAAAVRALVDVVATRAAIGAGSDVCDVGCGYGGTARVLAQDFSAAVVGYTLSPTQHAIACAQQGGAATRFVLGDWLENDLPDASFDAAIAIESTEHMADKGRFFAEAARVLRPGGRLAVCAWLAADDADGWRRTHLLEPICVEGRLPSMGTPAEYRAMIAGAGLALVSYDDITANVQRTWRHCTFRLLRRLTRPSSWQYLLDARNRDRIFALTVPRIWLAYATGAMRYGLFVARRLDASDAGAVQPDPAVLVQADPSTGGARGEEP